MDTKKSDKDMKPGDTKFVGYVEKPKWHDLDVFVMNHQVLITILSVVSFLVASFLSTKSILLSSIPFVIGLIGLYLAMFRGGIIF